MPRSNIGRLLVSRWALPASVDIVLVLVKVLSVRDTGWRGDVGSEAGPGAAAGVSSVAGEDGSKGMSGGAAMVDDEGSGVAVGVGLPGLQFTSFGMGRWE